MDSAAICTGHYSRVKNVFQIPSAHMHIVKNMPMFWSRMPPGCFQVILEDCICNGELALSAKLEQEVSIVIAATNAVPTMNIFPGH